MITTVKHAAWLTYFYLISPRSLLTAPGWRNYCGLLGWGDFTTQTTLRFYYPNHPTEYPEEIYDCRLTAPGWRESLRSYGLRRFYNPNHPVNIAYGRNRSTRRKSTTVGRAFTNSSLKCNESEVGIEPTISEVTGACSDDCATWSLLCRTKQSYTRNWNSLALARVSL